MLLENRTEGLECLICLVFQPPQYHQISGLVIQIILFSQNFYFLFQFGINFGKKKKFIKTGDPIVAITGWRQGAGSSNTVRILYVE